MLDTQKHSPLKNAPFRQAGESLNDRLEEILYYKLLPPMVGILCVFIIGLYDLFRVYFNAVPNPSLWFLVGILLVAYYYRRLSGYWQEAKNVGLGLRGEKIVGEMLEGLRRDGYEIYHDLINEKGNIDHIIIGPTGVFTIETKTVSKAGDQKVSFNGKNILIDGKLPFNDPIKQAEGEASWLGEFISKNLGATYAIKVKPVIIYPGWFIDPSCKNANVLIFNVHEKGLPGYLERIKDSLDSSQIDVVSNLIGNYIRNHKVMVG